MTVEMPSMFAKTIQDHLELKERNAKLEESMPLGHYKTADPFDNHPLFKSEEQARLEETMDGAPDFVAVDTLGELRQRAEARPHLRLGQRMLGMVGAAGIDQP